jgi:hypothetical protein
MIEFLDLQNVRLVRHGWGAANIAGGAFRPGRRLPLKNMRALEENAPMNPTENGRYDMVSYRMIVACLGAAVLLSGAGYVLLALQGKPTPEALIALGTGALGALSSFLVPGR